MWRFRCVECGLVDGFTGEKIHPYAPGSKVLAAYSSANGGQWCWEQAEAFWYQCAGEEPKRIDDPAATVADIEADAERVFA